MTLRNHADRCLLSALINILFFTVLAIFFTDRKLLIKSEYLAQRNASDSVFSFLCIIFIIFNLFYLQKPVNRVKSVIRLITDFWPLLAKVPLVIMDLKLSQAVHVIRKDYVLGTAVHQLQC